MRNMTEYGIEQLMQCARPAVSGISAIKKFGTRLTPIALLVVLGACASNDVEPPVASITRAESAIDDAMDNGARQYAAAEVSQAQAYLEKSRGLSQDKDYREAARYAERARADAEYAAAKTQRMVAADALSEVEQSLDALERQGRPVGSQTP